MLLLWGAIHSITAVRQSGPFLESESEWSGCVLDIGCMAVYLFTSLCSQGACSLVGKTILTHGRVNSDPDLRLVAQREDRPSWE